MPRVIVKMPLYYLVQSEAERQNLDVYGIKVGMVLEGSSMEQIKRVCEALEISEVEEIK